MAELFGLLAWARARMSRPVEPRAQPSSPPADSFAASLDRAQAAWRREMAAHNNELGVVQFPPHAMLEPRHVSDCVLLARREDIIARMPKGGVAAEVGVQTGAFSEAIQAIGEPRELHLIDIDLTRFDIAGKFAPQIAAGAVHLHEADSAATLARFPDAYFDYIYVDGDHSYRGVKRDIEAGAPKVRPDGFLLFNDYTFWSPAECMPYGVMQAVNELCIKDDWRLVYFALGYYGYFDVALARIGEGA